MRSNMPEDDGAARLSDLAPEVASTVVRVAGDIALVIGADDVIRNVATGSRALSDSGQTWVGRPWIETVSALNRGKAEQILAEARQNGVSRRRELNHPVLEGGEIPVSWAAVRLGEQGPLLAVGRDLRAVSAIQQRFLDAQRDLERDYWQRRNAETQYRLLFQVARDGVLVLDAETNLILDANPASAMLLGHEPAQWAGQPLQPLVDPALRPLLDELLITAQATGRAAEVRLRAASGGAPLDVSATPFRSEGRRCLLLRMRRADLSATDAPAVAEFIGQTPDAVVVADVAGRIQWANPAFAELCQAPDESRIKGYAIANLLGDPQFQWPDLLARVRARGIVSRAVVHLRVPGARARQAQVDDGPADDAAGALMADGDQEHIGLTLRMLSDKTPGDGAGDELALDITALLSQVGQAPLPELLEEASRRIETHFIQSALRAAGGRLDVAAGALRLRTDALLQRMTRLNLPMPSPTGSDGQPPLVN